MTKGKIQEQIKNLENKKTEIDEKINSLSLKLSNESESAEWIGIPDTDYEVTKQVIHKGKSYNDILKLMKPKEELLTLELIGTICENPDLFKTLKMDSSSTNDDFFFKQPFSQNEKKGYVARFYAYSSYAYLGCLEYSDIAGSYRGVRFCRKKIKRKR